MLKVFGWTEARSRSVTKRLLTVILLHFLLVGAVEAAGGIKRIVVTDPKLLYDDIPLYDSVKLKGEININHDFTVHDMTPIVSGYPSGESGKKNTYIIDLPDQMPADQLRKLDFTDPLDGSEYTGRVEVTDPAARFLWLATVAGYIDGMLMGEISYGKLEGNKIYEKQWAYTTKDVRIAGSLETVDETGKGTHIYNVDLKKGWNSLYLIITLDMATKESSIEYITPAKPIPGLDWWWP